MIKTLNPRINAHSLFSQTLPLKDAVRNSVTFVMSQINSLYPFPTAPPIWTQDCCFYIIKAAGGHFYYNNFLSYLLKPSLYSDSSTNQRNLILSQMICLMCYCQNIA